MGWERFPELERDSLAEFSGFGVVRAARKLEAGGAVLEASWEYPVASGQVKGADGNVHAVELDLRSLTFVRCRCDCPEGRAGRVCVHALALYLGLRKRQEREEAAAASGRAVSGGVAEATIQAGHAAKEAGAKAEAAEVRVRSLRLAEDGARLGLRLVLPPNLEAAAGRNAVVVKLELVPADGGPVAPEKLFKGRSYRLSEAGQGILAELESLCGGELYGLLQLKRGPLRELLLSEAEELAIWMGKETLGAAERRRRAEWLGQMEPAQESAVAVQRSREAAGGRKDPVARRTVGAKSSGAKSAVAGRRPLGTAGAGAFPSERERLPENWMVVDGSCKFLAIMLRERDHPQYRRAVEWLRAEGFRKESTNGKWWMRDQHKVLNFLATRREQLEADFDCGFTENFRQRTANLVGVKARARAERQGSDFELDVQLEADGLAPGEVQRALLSSRHYIHGAEGKIYLLPDRQVEQFGSLSQALGEDPGQAVTGRFRARLGAASLADAEKLLEDLEGEVELPADWQKRSRAIREVGHLEEPPLPAEMRERLRAYQLIGVAWLRHLYRNRLGGILADEMGLGKTIQAIGLMRSIRGEEAEAGPMLVVAPASLLGNWRRELSQWAPGMRVLLHHGAGRVERWEAEIGQSDVVITSYSTLRNDSSLLSEREYAMVIADEAQHVKNRRTHAARALRSLQARGRFILTGTPIENSMEDLRSLFGFCLPGYLKRVPREARGEERGWYDQRHLEKAAPYILRRGKREVAPELPDKIEQTLWVELSTAQREMYERQQRQSEQQMLQMAEAGMSENRMRFAMLTELLRLRQVCADPGTVDEDFPLEGSAKYLAFRELLEEALDGGHRLLVFSQFVKLLKRVRGALEAEGHTVAYIDGQTKNRLAVCERFNRDESIPLCLISLKAGGTGLNLAGADTVVHFDPWWNPAVEDQATDRAHRIGQTRTVTSYKLVTEGTVEDKVRQLQLKKASLLRELLDESQAQTARVDLETLQSLIRN